LKLIVLIETAYPLIQTPRVLARMLAFRSIVTTPFETFERLDRAGKCACRYFIVTAAVANQIYPTASGEMHALL
jgi:hypothetical protein